MRFFTRCLALLAVISVSGIHVPFMQVGAWGLMLWQRDHGAGTPALAEAIGDLLAGTKPCPRCLATLKAGLESGHDSSDRQGPAPSDAGELRLIPVDWQICRLVPPPPGRRTRAAELPLPAPIGAAGPDSPPPEGAALPTPA